MTRPTVVVTHWIHDEVLAMLSSFSNVIGNESRDSWNRIQKKEALSQADAVMVFMPDMVDQHFLDAAPNLKLVACALKGYDNIDLAACERARVRVTIVDDLLTIPSAELAIGLMISAGRNVLAGDQLIRSGQFQGWRPNLYGTGLAGSVVGIVGMGQIGHRVAERLGKFQCRVLYHDVKRLGIHEEMLVGVEYRLLDEMLPQCDFVVLAMPLNAATNKAVGTHFLSDMKPGAILVNIARGSLVDERAVAQALESGQLGSYAADVFAFEDWAQSGRPEEIEPTLVSSGRTILTPHLGSAVDRVRREIAHTAALSIRDFFEGRQPRGQIATTRQALEAGRA